jgi:hypothetical protein
VYKRIYFLSLQNVKNYTLMTDVCRLSVSLHLSVPWYLSAGPDSSKYAGINEAMNDVLTCQKLHLLCLANTFKCKTKVHLWLYLTFRHQKKDKNKDFAYFQNPVLKRSFSRCLNSFIRDTVHSADPSRTYSALCWWRMFDCGLCVQCVQDCDTANT